MVQKDLLHQPDPVAIAGHPWTSIDVGESFFIPDVAPSDTYKFSHAVRVLSGSVKKLSAKAVERDGVPGTFVTRVQ